jgi:hypothetical protein
MWEGASVKWMLKKYALLCMPCALSMGLGVAMADDFTALPEYQKKIEASLHMAGENRAELMRALKDVPAEQRKALQFLIGHMPEADAKSISADYLLRNVAWAYKARETFPWAKQVPEDVFFNDVLPYACLDERRDDWRGDFYNRFRKHVQGAQSQKEALEAVNREILKEVGVDYSTQRKKANQSPYESMVQGVASCTGLSILLNNAFRSVGIPSRVVGTPAWTTKRGNHNWVEVWTVDDKSWHFTEYHPDKKGLDHGWLLADAAQGNAKSLLHSIYATSWKSSDSYFPMVWNPKNEQIPAENVTGRYAKLGGQMDESLCELRIHLAQEGKRVETSVIVVQGDLKICEGTSPKPTDDMNRYFTAKVRKGQRYQVFWKDISSGKMKSKPVTTPKDQAWLVVDLQPE